MLLILAIVGPAHAPKGEVRLEIRTDDLEGRLASGTIVPTELAHAGPLTISRLRFDGSCWFAAFEQAHDHMAAKALREVRLLVETGDDRGDESYDENHKVSGEAWHHHELVGLRALSVSGEGLGEIIDVEPGVAQDRLMVITPEGDDVAVLFTEAFILTVDPEADTVAPALPGGLFPGRGQAEEAR